MIYTNMDTDMATDGWLVGQIVEYFYNGTVFI